MQRAPVPVAPVASLPYLQLCLAFLGGLCAPFGLGILKEQITPRVSSSNFVEQRTHLPVLGEITRLPTKNPKTASLGYREQLTLRVFEESIDAMRTNLLLGAQGGSLRILCVTSAVNQEGKTSVAVQLAISTARATRQQVLIIDGDLRAPGIHETFQFPLEPGLTDVLAGDCPLDAAIIATGTEGVDALPAGLLQCNPYSLVTHERWEGFLKQIPAKYRYVIIDTPPVLAASETLLLTRCADAVLICAMRDVSRLAQLKKATDRIVSTGSNVAGLVLSGVPTRNYVNRYGSYSYWSIG